jgi:chromate transporter
MYARRQRGARGAISAISGLYIFPTIITILLGGLYARWGRIPVVEQMFGAIMPVAAGLVIGTALRLGRSLPATAQTFVFVFLAFSMMALLAWPLWLVLALLAPASIMIAWRRAHHDVERPS